MLLLAAILAFAPAPVDVPEIEREIRVLTNNERATHGLRTLAHDKNLEEAARRHSADMLRRRFFNHVNPEGEGPADRVARYDRRRFMEVGENIWMGTGYPTPRVERIAGEIVAAWMKSRGHRENILRPEYAMLGVGVMVSGGSVYATQVFAARER